MMCAYGKIWGKTNIYDEEYVNFFPVCFISVLILTLVKFFFLKAEKDNKRLKICPHNPLMNCELFNPVLLRYHIP